MLYYEPEKADHGLPHDPLKSLLVPRPIGWISTIDAGGRANLAPYSFFNFVAGHPPCVMFGAAVRDDGEKKDSPRLAAETGDFVVNIVSYAQREAMMVTAVPFPSGDNEFERAGLEMLPSTRVKAPRVKGAPAHFECRYLQTVELPPDQHGGRNVMVLGEVVGVHIDENVLVKGKVDIGRLQPVCRIGSLDYAMIDRVFTMRVPAMPGE